MMETNVDRLINAMHDRHSVRAYTDKPIEAEKVAALRAAVDECNRESGMNIQLVVEKPEAFDSRLAHYGKFSGVRNFIALVGKRGSDLAVKSGYYGEKLVLEAQCLGLNTCWVALTYNKRKSRNIVQIGQGEKLMCVISIGYGETPGVAHKCKLSSEVSVVRGSDYVPVWFSRGVDAALLAPTALNQQKFKFILHGLDTVEARAKIGFYSKVDLGIVKYHFEIGAGKDNFRWK